MIIDIVLPFKEIFSQNSASAVSLTVKNSMEFSKYKKTITVYGQYTKKPFYKENFVGIKTNKFLHFGNNLSLIKNYIKLYKKNNNKIRLIEIHNRPYLFNYLIKKLPKQPIILYYHNDATTMKGSKSISERKSILKKAAGVVFVSEYVKKKFLEGIKNKVNNIYVLPNGIIRQLKKKPKKKKIILFVGRLVEEKGAHIFINSLKSLHKEFPSWSFLIIGTAKAGQKKLVTNYEKKIINSFLKLGNQAIYHGFIPNSDVKRIMNSSSILVVPSIWDDPFPLTALEGLASGQVVVASERGGLKEMLKDLGILIKNINEKKLGSELKNLISNNKKLLFYQNKAWKNFKYDQKTVSKKQDLIRLKVLNEFNSA